MSTRARASGVREYVFEGRVRKWVKTWVPMSGAQGDKASKVRVLKWLPTGGVSARIEKKRGQYCMLFQHPRGADRGQRDGCGSHVIVCTKHVTALPVPTRLHGLRCAHIWRRC